MKMRNPAAITFRLERNPRLRPPSTVMGMGVDEAISWWEDVGRFGEGTSNKLKMVLVGLAEAGKTTVVRNITGRPIPNKMDRTVGIEITEGWEPVDGGPLEVSIWDFAGQADYFASHQIFLTEGSLFLLVVDLRALVLEGTGGVNKGGDPHGRVYRWLEMLHLRVPGAAVALVGTHTDAPEFKDPAKLEEAVYRLDQLIARYREDKTKERANIEAMHHGLARGLEEEKVHRRVMDGRPSSPLKAPEPPIIHPKVFRTSLDHDSTAELVEWVGNAATLLDCPAGFNFPTVRSPIPTAWIDANSAMDGLKAEPSGKRYVSWREAVKTFEYFMETKGTPIPDAEDILLRAMRHREAEGGVLLTLHDGSAHMGGSAGMLYLHPGWLIELIRRLTDHNLVDPSNQGTLKNALEKYGEEHNPRLSLDELWEQHRSYIKSGTLDLAYLRFLWLHHQLETSEVNIDLTLDEFNSAVASMEGLLVLYRAPATEVSNHTLYVVPARLPEYGDEQVLEKGGLALGDIVQRTTCSFRRSYAPPGVIGRFLAFSNAHISEARECWQHGAHLIWIPGFHDVIVYEVESIETSGNDSVAYPGLELCVKGTTPFVREVLGSLKKEVKRMFEDEVYGYPGICSVVFEDTTSVDVSSLLNGLCKHLDNRLEQLSATITKVAQVTSEVLQACYLAAEEANEYPRLVILKPEIDLQLNVKPRISPAKRSFQRVCSIGQQATAGAQAAEGMQRATWYKWIEAFKEGRAFRMVFICEHDLTEVKCGPDGKGYRVKDLPGWTKACLPLLQVSLLALRVAVGAVSHVDLPLDDLLAAVVKSASLEFLDSTGTSVSVSSLAEGAALPNESAGGGQQQQKRLQKNGYAALCQFMQTMESPSTTCCGLRSQCSACGSTQSGDCVCVGWKSQMVRVSNGNGGLVWVKRTNEASYTEKVTREAEMSSKGPHA